MEKEVTYHPVDMEWTAGLFESRLEGPRRPELEKPLFGLADRITNLKMVSTALARELGPNDAAIFAAHHRPFFVLEDDPGGLAGTLDALVASDTIEEMMNILADKAARVYNSDITDDPEDIVQRNGLKMRIGALDAGSVEAFFSDLKRLYDEAMPRRTATGKEVPTAAAKEKLAFALATGVGRVALKTGPAWYMQDLSLSAVVELPGMDKLRRLTGNIIAEMPWLGKKVPDLDVVAPRCYREGYCPGVYIPAKNVPAVMALLEEWKGGITAQLRKGNHSQGQIDALFRVASEVGTYSSRHGKGIMEEVDLSEVFD